MCSISPTIVTTKNTKTHRRLEQFLVGVSLFVFVVLFSVFHFLVVMKP